MSEDILSIVKDAFSNIYFIAIISIVIVGVTIENKLNYKKYLKTCEIFGQEPKKSGYIRNSIIQAFIIIIITIIGFLGYESLKNSQRFVEKFENKMLKKEKNIVKKIEPIKEKKNDIKYSVSGKVVKKEEFLNNTVSREKKPYKDEHQVAKENLLNQMKN